MNTDSTTTAVLSAVRHAVDGMTPDGGADPGAGLPQIMTAARTRRRRRRLAACGGVTGAGLAVSAGLALAVAAPGAGPHAPAAVGAAGSAGAGNQPGTGGTASAGGTARAGQDVSLAAWTVRAEAGGSVTVTLRELADAPQLKQALAANNVPALLHFGPGPCSADHAPQRGPIGLVEARLVGADHHLVITMTFKALLWPAASELYVANNPQLGPQLAVIPQGHYQGCA